MRSMRSICEAVQSIHLTAPSSVTCAHLVYVLRLDGCFAARHGLLQWYVGSGRAFSRLVTPSVLAWHSSQSPPTNSILPILPSNYNLIEQSTPHVGTVDCNRRRQRRSDPAPGANHLSWMRVVVNQSPRDRQRHNGLKSRPKPTVSKIDEPWMESRGADSLDSWAMLPIHDTW